MDLFAGRNAALLIPLAAIIGGCLMGILAVAATQWRRVRVAEIEAALKQQMLDRGMSAAEIEQVLRARSGQPGMLQYMRGGEDHRGGCAAQCRD